MPFKFSKRNKKGTKENQIKKERKGKLKLKADRIAVKEAQRKFTKPNSGDYFRDYAGTLRACLRDSKLTLPREKVFI